MPKTLLDGVNEILTRVNVIAGDSGRLSSLTDSARQPSIDVAVQVINEGVDELYTTIEAPRPTERKEGTISLLLDTRNYTLATDLVQLRFPFIDYDNTQYINEYPGGYRQMRVDDGAQETTGLPHFGAINDETGEFYIDSKPQADDVGRVYTYPYDRELVLSTVSDTFPFSDMAFRAMVPAWTQLWKRDRRNEMDDGIFNASIGRASRLIEKTTPRSHYNPRAM